MSEQIEEWSPAPRADDAPAPIARMDAVASGHHPLISVVIPTHNRSRELREAVNSASAQEDAGTSFDVEVVVVDDASTDDTPQVVQTLPAVRYVRLGENRGLSAARNAGISASRGDYVAFLDDDDLLLPGFGRTLLSARADVAYSTVVAELDGVRKAGAEQRRHPSGDLFPALLRREVFLFVHAVLIRRSVLLEAGGFDETLAGLEDFDLWLRLAHRHRFRFVPGPVAVYRRSSAGMWTRTIRAGEHRALYRRILERALTLRPAPPGLRAAVLDNIDIHALEEWIAARPAAATGATEFVAEWLATHPGLLRYPRCRHVVADFTRMLATAGSAETAQAFLGDVQRTCGRGWQSNRLIARAWVEIGIGQCASRRWRGAGRAFLAAARCDPTQFVARLAKAGTDRIGAEPVGRLVRALAFPARRRGPLAWSREQFAAAAPNAQRDGRRR